MSKLESRVQQLEQELAALRQQLLAPSTDRRVVLGTVEAQPVPMQQQAAPTLKEAQEACRMLGGEAATVVRRYLDSLPVSRASWVRAAADAVVFQLSQLEITPEEALVIFQEVRRPIYASLGAAAREEVMRYEPLHPVEMAVATQRLLVSKLRQWLDRAGHQAAASDQETTP